MSLERHLGELEALERRQALRALLARPLISAEDEPETLRLIRRHAGWLREWFDAHPRWMLSVDSEVARLFKVPGELSDTTRGARDPKKQHPLTRRAYVLFCLAAAALEKRRQERQTTLGELARQVAQQLSLDPRLAAIGLDLEQRGHRRELVAALRLLVEVGVLRRVEGHEEHYVQSGGERDVLYGIRRTLLTLLLATRRGPSTLDPALDFERRLATICEESLPDDDKGRNRRIRSELSRRLLDDPVLYLDGLSADARDYFTSQRAHLCRSLGGACGLTAEVRSEGVALVDEASPLTDRRMPEEGTTGHATLLIAEYLADLLRGAREAGDAGAMEVPWARLEAHIAELAERFKAFWRRAAREPAAQVELCADVVTRLVELGLVERSETGVRARPAIARFAQQADERLGR